MQEKIQFIINNFDTHASIRHPKEKISCFILTHYLVLQLNKHTSNGFLT